MRLIPAILTTLFLASRTLADVRVDPAELHLQGPRSQYQVLVSELGADNREIDRTLQVKYKVLDPTIASVSAEGLVRARKDGDTKLIVERDGKSQSIPIVIRDVRKPHDFHFETDITPLLGRYGCNASGCHGKAEGQNGFKLSVFGFDPEADHAALVKEARGRRLFPSNPEKSLLLTKGSGQVPHGGGNRLPANSDAFEVIREWIAAGAPIGSGDAPRIESIRIEPSDRVMGMQAEQQLRVMATFSNGRKVDVTSQARFQSNNEPVAVVSASGVVRTSDVPGEAAVMASYLGEVSNFRLVVPRPGKIEDVVWTSKNFIDPLVEAKLKKLNIGPSGEADDSTFVRRVHLDIIGTLPTPDEARAFLKDPRADKRTKLIDALLDRPEYVDYWSLKWADVLRVDRAVLGHRRAYSYYHWIRESVAKNKPLDRFAAELATAEGPIDETPAANFYRVFAKPGEAASAYAQVFLGVRIACAECHHHPYDRWSQDDYFKMSAFFSPVSVRKLANVDAVVVGDNFTAKNTRTGIVLKATPLGSPGVDLAKSDHRQYLADWLAAKDNPFFARNVANRFWAHFLGRGLVDPVDDFRSTNPPTNPELLDALAREFRESGYDAKKLIRMIVNSRTYQATYSANPSNERDEQNYSRFLFRGPDAEVHLDMISQVTGVPEKFEGFPVGTRSIQLWDSKVRHYFLKTFGRPARASVCECERQTETNIAAVLHLLNGDTVLGKLNHDNGTLTKLLASQGDDAAVVDELFMLCYSRPPTPKEQATVAAHVARLGAGKRKQAFEDVFWALLNSKEFLFNH